jgi:DNA-binding response OmpR family regulator
MRILLVEDDKLLGDGVREGLRQASWTVDWVRDGKAAEQALGVDAFDLVVLDLGLPKRPGIEIIRWLRARGDHIPVLVLTATDAVSQRVNALDAGADDYVTKPFDLDELCARVRALHRRSVGSPAPVLSHGGIALDTCSRSVTCDGREITLSPKEFAILQALVENAGKVVPRERLMTSIYGWDDDIGSNVLEVHIHHLRRKLAATTLKAVRGIGYRLN